MSTMQPIKEIEQIKQIEEILKKKNYRNYIIFKFGVYSGYRISDIIKLKVSDVKGKDYFETIELKRDKKRKVKILPSFKEELNLYIENKKDDEYLFPSKKYKDKVKKKVRVKNEETGKMNSVYIEVENESPNSPIDRIQAWRILKDAFNQIGLYDTATHSLRKTFAYHIYINSGKDIVMVQRILGHSSPEQTLNYIGILQSDEDKLVCSLGY